MKTKLLIFIALGALSQSSFAMDAPVDGAASTSVATETTESIGLPLTQPDLPSQASATVDAPPSAGAAGHTMLSELDDRLSEYKHTISQLVKGGDTCMSEAQYRLNSLKLLMSVDRKTATTAVERTTTFLAEQPNIRTSDVHETLQFMIFLSKQ